MPFILLLSGSEEFLVLEMASVLPPICTSKPADVTRIRTLFLNKNRKILMQQSVAGKKEISK